MSEGVLSIDGQPVDEPYLDGRPGRVELPGADARGRRVLHDGRQPWAVVRQSEWGTVSRDDLIGPCSPCTGRSCARASVTEAVFLRSKLESLPAPWPTIIDWTVTIVVAVAAVLAIKAWVVTRTGSPPPRWSQPSTAPCPSRNARLDVGPRAREPVRLPLHDPSRATSSSSAAAQAANHARGHWASSSSGWSACPATPSRSARASSMSTRSRWRSRTSSAARSAGLRRRSRSARTSTS